MAYPKPQAPWPKASDLAASSASQAEEVVRQGLGLFLLGRGWEQ